MAIFYRREKEGNIWESREKIKSGSDEQNSTTAKENDETSTKTSTKTSMKTSEMITTFIKDNPSISIAELASLTGLTRQGAAWNIGKLKEKGILKRVGPAKGGHWEIIETISSQKHL